MNDVSNFVEIGAKIKIGVKRTLTEAVKTDMGQQVAEEEVESLKRKKME